MTRKREPIDDLIDPLVWMRERRWLKPAGYASCLDWRSAGSRQVTISSDAAAEITVLRRAADRVPDAGTRTEILNGIEAESGRPTPRRIRATRSGVTASD
jgi:hypothetical protein